ncbi:hypothetical protein [Amycolatopsis sp.]|uniref:hypothetical protein n=1 Tax=Amycolatopsis sp. TaxID=37632 RepID=UPI002CD99137|nr:hypothetical protein [Amycolatopsis sp.]HVV09930.1 hypothetical protein [Amycolatopsis sp.]
MRTPARVALVAALLSLTACGGQAQVNSGAPAVGGSPAVQAASPVQQTVDFGAQYHFADGVTVLVSAPKSFRPSTSAYPRSARAVAFEIAIHNDGDQPYRLSALSVSATAAGTAAKQVVDSTQGYSGIVDAGKDVPPGRDVQVTLAFAVPEPPSAMRLSLRPNATSSVVAVYCGSA